MYIQYSKMNQQGIKFTCKCFRFLAVFMGPEGSGKYLQELGAALGTALSDQVQL
jgi:hypothetical protein